MRTFDKSINRFVLSGVIDSKKERRKTWREAGFNYDYIIVEAIVLGLPKHVPEKQYIPINVVDRNMFALLVKRDVMYTFYGYIHMDMKKYRATRETNLYLLRYEIGRTKWRT